MKPRWRGTTSLFARLSLTFGLLVTVPLAVSGLLLSWVGRNSLDESGRAMSALGQAAVKQTSEKLRGVVEHSIEGVTEQVSKRARQSLDVASAQHSTVAQTAVQAATDGIIKNSGSAFARAAGQSATLGETAVAGAATELRTLHQESLGILQAKFVEATEAALKTATADVRPQINEYVIEFANAINQSKADGLIVTAKIGIDYLQLRLSVASRSQAVMGFEEQDAVRTLRLLRGMQPRSLEAQQVYLISDSGDELVSVPEAEPQPKGAWRREFAAIQQKGDAIFVVPGKNGIPLLRLVARVSDYNDQPPTYGAIVADVSLQRLAEMVSPQPREGRSTMLLVTGDGRVVSSSENGQVGSTVPAVREALRNVPPEQERIPPFRFRGEDGKERLAVAARWSVILTDSAARFYAVVLQPEEEALRPVERLEKRVAESWQGALSKVGSSGEGLIKRRLESIRPRQEEIARVAARDINAKIRKVGDRVPAAMAASREKILVASRVAIQGQTRAATESTAKDIQQVREAEARRAKGQLNYQTEAETARSLDAMNYAAAEEARRHVADMVRNSSWLIVMFLALALILATLTTRSIVRPIDRLVKGTQAIAKGDYSQRIRAEGEDELARLAGAFNEMATAVEAGQDDLRRSHDVLAAQKRRIQTIVDSSPDGLVLLEPDGKVSFMNPAARAMLSPRQRELPAAPTALECLPEPAGERIRECIEQLEVGGPAQEMEIDGPPRHVFQYRGVAIAGEDGRQGLLLHLHDITRERQIDEMKSDFVSLVSHELRTPLTSILGFSSYLLTGKLGSINEPQQRALDSIHRQSKRLSAIISDFLDVSRIESGKIEMRQDPVTVDSVARRVIADLHPQAAEKSIAVRAQVAGGEEGLVALGDEGRIAQVFTNLLGNALKFTGQEGTVEVLLARRNGEILCRVKDSGCGIPPDELDRVFDRFYQVEKVVTRKSGGTGLGLAIVKNIVEAHGGRIGISSEYGKGTEVTFSLPAA